MTPTTYDPPRPILLAGLGLALGLAAVLVQPACSESTCSVDPRFPDEPVPALECAAGDLCYRGACVTGCTAGRERTEECESDGDCSGARSRCVDGYCSACEASEQCIPVIDVCQSVLDIPLPPEPELPNPNRPRPPRPRDAGTLDDGLTRDRDAGVDPTGPPRPITHVVFVDLAQTVRLSAGTASSAVTVRAFDVRGTSAGLIWRPDIQPIAVEEPISANDDCELNRLRTRTASATPTTFGRIVVDDFDGSGAFIGDNVEAEWVQADATYRVTPDPLPANLLRLSDFDTLDSTFISVTGPGVADLTDRSWPNPQVSLHVPFDLQPEPATRVLLESTQVLGQIQVRDLTFRWARVGTGVVATERVVVRIPGNQHEIICRQIEGPGTDGTITVSAGLLDDFRSREAAAVDAEYPLYFERASAQQLQVDPAPARINELRHFVSVRVRHTFETKIRF